MDTGFAGEQSEFQEHLTGYTVNSEIFLKQLDFRGWTELQNFGK